MKHCCAYFDNFAENSKKILWHVNGKNWALLYFPDIRHPGVPTMSEYKTINYCPFCGQELKSGNE